MLQGFETSREMSRSSKTEERRHWHDLSSDVLTHFPNDESQRVSNNEC